MKASDMDNSGTEFSRIMLEDDGFEGWVPILETPRGDSLRSNGVYVVSWPKGVAPQFLSESRGGWFKGRDPTVSSAVLAENWIEDAEILYVGSSHGATSSLSSRLATLRRFGEGMPVAHWGGRLLWQISAPHLLEVGWKPTDREFARPTEKTLLEQFIRSYGRLPFANLRR